MNRLTRKSFVRTALAGLAGAVVGSRRGSLAAIELNEPPAGMIDCHTHFYDPTRPEGVPWPGKDDKLLYRRVLPEEFKKLVRPLGITGTIAVEASPWLEDNQWLLELAKDEPFIVGVVGNLKPGDPKFADHLKRFAVNPLFRGIRIAHASLAAGLAERAFVTDLARLAEHDLELDVNGGPNMLPDVSRIAEKLPRLRIVVNHVANVRIDGKALPADWVLGMRVARERANVSCKVSALVEGATPRDGKAPAETEFYRHVLDAVWNAFGEDRLIYASNWPVSERFASTETLLRIVREYFRGHGELAVEKFFWRNSQTAYRWTTR